jgi:hypothetical protein
MFAVKPFRELRSAISVERAWRGLSPSRAVGAWSLAARQEARLPVSRLLNSNLSADRSRRLSRVSRAALLQHAQHSTGL